VDSDNFAYDSFEWSVFNLSGERLFTLDFDNSDLDIYYRSTTRLAITPPAAHSKTVPSTN
jgi:hypothetical protein